MANSVYRMLIHTATSPPTVESVTTAFANSSCFPGFGQKLPSEMLLCIDEGIYANTDAETGKCVSICDLATVIATTFLLTLKGPSVLESLAKFTGFADDLSKAMEVFHDLRHAIMVNNRVEIIERTVDKVQSDVGVLQEGFSAVYATAPGASCNRNGIHVYYYSGYWRVLSMVPHRSFTGLNGKIKWTDAWACYYIHVAGNVT